jgi:hypothetical protein
MMGRAPRGAKRKKRKGDKEKTCITAEACFNNHADLTHIVKAHFELLLPQFNIPDEEDEYHFISADRRSHCGFDELYG